MTMELLLFKLLICFKAICCIGNHGELRRPAGGQGGQGGQYFISEPADVIGQAGETLALPCLVGNKQGSCQWTRDGLGLGVDLGLPAYPRFSMSSDSCDLTIFPLLPQDDGVYECQVLAVAGTAPLTSRPALLTVLAEPGQPHISQATAGDLMELAMGQKVTLECESLGGKPAADIQWSYADYADGAAVLADNVTQSTGMMEGNTTFRTVSHVTIMPGTDLTVICTATNTALQTEKTSRLHIRLLHKPQIHLSTDTARVREGMTVEVMCSSDVYPEVVTYSWFINRQEIREEQERTLRIENISRAYDKMEIICRGTNKVGSDEASKVLTVEFAPEVITHPTDTFAKEGDTITFYCAGAGNPPPAYVWIDNNSKEVLGFTQNFLIKASPATELEYVCRVFSDGFQPADSRPASLGLIRKPEILTVNFKEMGGEKLIHCSVKSASKDSKITWMKDGKPILVGDKDHEVIYNKDILFHHSYLILKSKQKEDYRYSCYASNEVGTDIQDALLASNDSDFMFILAPVIVTAIVVILLGSIGVLIFRRLKHASVEKMEWEKKLQSLTVESQPCLGTLTCNNTNLGFVKGGLSPNVSWHNFNTLSAVLTNSSSIHLSTPNKAVLTVY
eukprot:GFUD01006688.1.p1 GENE.GFUD01006688.1~~GFUD01006688.1.p1  ORF type:complete len:620 (-),score=142.32 GFUD01006688.1:112-1971(-)